MENKDKNIEIAKRIIIEEVEKAGYHVDRIILFGSRARGDYQKGSDYDFLIAIDKDLARNEKINLTSKISLRLSDYIASDIIIKSGKKLLKEKDDKGLIGYYALKEGVALV